MGTQTIGYDKINQLTNDSRVTFDVYQIEAEKAANNKIKVEVNGDKLITDVDPVEINGRVLVPMRAIFECYNAEIVWDEATSTATATRRSWTRCWPARWAAKSAPRPKKAPSRPICRSSWAACMPFAAGPCSCT